MFVEFLIWGLYVAVSPLIAVMLSRALTGRNLLERPEALRLMMGLSSVGSLVFVVGILFTASETLGHLAMLGLPPAVLLMFAIPRGVETVLRELFGIAIPR